MEWQPIETAPKDGTKVRVCQLIDGKPQFDRIATWRTVEFESFINGRHGVEPGYTATGWMYPDKDKRVPEPTHWMSQ